MNELQPLLDVRGVRGAATLDALGNVTAQGGEALDTTLVSAVRAVLQSLQAATQSPSWNELLLDLDQGGPLLLTPRGDGVLLTMLDDLSSLGRVRLGIRKV